MAEDVAYMAVKSVGLSSVGGRKPCSLLDAARHNLREIQAEMGAADHIDPERSYSNVILGGPESAVGVQAAADALLAIAGVERLRRDHCQAIEFVFSLPVGCSIDVADYFSKCLGWMKSALPLPVLSAVIHRDESAPHMHVLLLPLDGEGRHVGGAPIGREQLKRLRASFFGAVAGRFGLRREGAKLRGQAKGWAVAAILRRCDDVGMPEACGALWPILRVAIERDPQAALAALKIDLDTIRRDVRVPLEKSRSSGVEQNPVGIEGSAQNPIGIENQSQKDQSLSCVGFGNSSPTKTDAARGVNSMQQRMKTSRADRVAAGRKAIEQVIARSHTCAPGGGVAGWPEGLGADGDGWARIRDEEPEMPWPDNW